MPSTSTYCSDEDDHLEVSIPTLPILTRAQHRRFIEEQKKIIRTLISKSFPEQVVYYTCFCSSTVHVDALESILEFQSVIREIILDQRSRTVFKFYNRLFPTGHLYYCGGRETIYRKGHLNTTMTATRSRLTRNLTKTL